MALLCFNNVVISHVALFTSNILMVIYFVIAQEAMVTIPPFLFTALRIAVATPPVVLLALFFEYRERRRNHPKSTEEDAQQQQQQHLESNQSSDSTAEADSVNREESEGQCPPVASEENADEAMDVPLHTQQEMTTSNGIKKKLEVVSGWLRDHWKRYELKWKPIRKRYSGWFTIPSLIDLLGCVMMGVVGIAINQNMFVKGVEETSANNAAVFEPCIPVFTTLMAFTLRQERVSLIKIISVAMAVIGSVIVLVLGKGDFQFDTANMFWNLLFIGHCFCLAFYLIVGREVSRRLPVMTTSAYAMVLGLVFVIAMACYSIPTTDFGRITTLAWIACVYSGLFATAFSYSLSVFAATHTSPVVVSMYSCLVPIKTAIASYLVFGESITWGTAIGAALILIGVTTLLWAKWKEQQKLIQQQQQHCEEIVLGDTNTTATTVRVEVDGGLDDDIPPTAQSTTTTTTTTAAAATAATDS